MSNAKAVPLAKVSRDVLVAAQHTSHRAIASAQLVAERGIDLERRAFDHATRSITSRAGNRGTRIQVALNGAADEIDNGVRRAIADVADAGKFAVLSVASVMDQLVVKRVELAFDGALVRSIERVGMPVGETLRSATQGVRTLADRLHDALIAEVADGKVEGARARKRTVRARRKVA